MALLSVYFTIKTTNHNKRIMLIETATVERHTTTEETNPIEETTYKEETTYEKEKAVALGDIDRMRGYKKAETYDIRERLEKLAAERGRPEVSYTQELKERSDDEQER